MAVLSGRDRGQLLLLGAIVIGFVIVTLSLTLNGGLYAETVADRAVDDVGATETQYLLADIRGDAGFILGNAIASSSLPGQQATYVTENVQALDEEYTEYYARSDAVVDISVDDTALGVHASQRSGAFDEPLSDDSNWEVYSNGRVRNVSLTVDSGTGNPARLVFDDGEQYDVVVTDSSVSVEFPSGTTADCATGLSTPYTVDISAATVNGEPCPALEFRSALDDTYTVRVENGDQVTGSYNFLADGFARGTQTQERTYAVELAVTHRTTTADYEGTIRVAPEEI